MDTQTKETEIRGGSNVTMEVETNIMQSQDMEYVTSSSNWSFKE